MRIFQYKIIHRILPTNKLLHIYNVASHTCHNITIMMNAICIWLSAAIFTHSPGINIYLTSVRTGETWMSTTIPPCLTHQSQVLIAVFWYLHTRTREYGAAVKGRETNATLFVEFEKISLGYVWSTHFISLGLQQTTVRMYIIWNRIIGGGGGWNGATLISDIWFLRGCDIWYLICLGVKISDIWFFRGIWYLIFRGSNIWYLIAFHPPIIWITCTCVFTGALPQYYSITARNLHGTVCIHFVQRIMGAWHLFSAYFCNITIFYETRSFIFFFVLFYSFTYCKNIRMGTSC